MKAKELLEHEHEQHFDGLPYVKLQMAKTVCDMVVEHLDIVVASPSLKANLQALDFIKNVLAKDGDAVQVQASKPVKPKPKPKPKAE